MEKENKWISIQEAYLLAYLYGEVHPDDDTVSKWINRKMDIIEKIQKRREEDESHKSKD